MGATWQPWEGRGLVWPSFLGSLLEDLPAMRNNTGRTEAEEFTSRNNSTKEGEMHAARAPRRRASDKGEFQEPNLVAYCFYISLILVSNI